MNQLAEELNAILAGSTAGRLLSDLGKHMYFPKGILTQSAEAGEKAHRFNATIGMAYEDGKPMMLDALREALPTLSPEEAVAYAPTGGVMALRKEWKTAMSRKNPSLAGKSFSLPVVVPGLTAAVSYISDLFIDPGDEVVIPDMHWPNYRLIVEERKCAKGVTFPIFSLGGYNVKGLEAALHGTKGSKAVCLLNFPNNPTGYSLTLKEADAIIALLVALADGGRDVLVIADDAYFGLQYQEGLLRESIFARLADAHERILAVKADGPTKEDYVWGFRTGFITFAGKGLSEAAQDALVKKTLGIIRSSVSSSSGLAQHLLLKALLYPGYENQKTRYRKVLEGRYRAMMDYFSKRELPSCLEPLPFNSGYFMSFLCKGISAEALRVELLEKSSIGTISMQDKYLRVAFSSLEEEHIPEFLDIVVASAEKLAKKA
ncbi:MAG: aminotransferase class I/II-fold pyridoxal phosphate-dependent enzyme [Spirochaetes bacterium]|nr:aminotransferase class I/II-fold pyridoxal phosphate-dependent enzyme [Spirochaetota bacterium]